MNYNKIRLLRLLLIISLIITLSFIRTTYSKYQEKLDAEYSGGMKGWYIAVNDKDIYNETDLTKFMTPVFCDDLAKSNLVATNTFVPGSEQYLLFVVDYSKVNVSFEMKISVEQINSNKLEFFTIEGFTAGNLTNSTDTVVDNRTSDWNNKVSENYVVDTQIEVNDDSITVNNTTNTLSSETNSKIKYYKIYLNWDDSQKDENVIVNGVEMEKNHYDTTYNANGVSNSVGTNELKYKVNVSFKQVNAIQVGT